MYVWKLYRKLTISQAVLFIPSQDYISRTDTWKVPKLGTIAYQYSKMVLGIFDVQCPSLFFTAFLKKI